jgi:rare lipoprotein A (peptidoglycan hydrolase)
MKRLAIALVAIGAGVVPVATANTPTSGGASVQPAAFTSSSGLPPAIKPAAQIMRHSRKHHKSRPHLRFHTAFASEYGDGDGTLYQPLACGGTYQPSDMGVANKTLPCGTRLRICYRGCVNVRVVDRGPYIAGREYDLMIAPVRALRFPGLAHIRVARLP